VTIRIRPEGEQEFILEVQDTGSGIAPEDLGRLFIEFEQLDTGTAKKYQGTGLGLALTKRIVEAQGGKVGVRSTPEQGSTFFATLPRIARKIIEEEEYSWKSHLPLAAADSPVVLVIEEDAEERAWLTQFLLKAGFAVEIAATGAQAVSRCRKQTFDLITLALLLPDMSGWDVLKAIRSEGPNSEVPVIVITLVAEKKVGVGFPIQDVLSKPVQLKELLVSLERTLNAQHANGGRTNE
jgi:CheY-like chemotaxis protein